MPDFMAYRRTHSLLLVQRLLSFRPGVSPLTVILDSLEQSGRPVVEECIVRAKSNRLQVVYVAFETITPPAGVDAFIRGRPKDISALQEEIGNAIKATTATLLILDTLRYVLSQSVPIPGFLASLASKPGVSMLVTYHIDAPLATPRRTSSTHPPNSYQPSPLALLTHLSTTILTISSLPHAHAAYLARFRSLAEPLHGLNESRDGVLIGLGANGGGTRLAAAPLGYGRGIVLEVEHRRRSGRGVKEVVFLSLEDHSASEITDTAPMSNTDLKATSNVAKPSLLVLLDDHPCFRPPTEERLEETDQGETPESAAATFNLSLTERQRTERAGVVLPYYDAQREGSEGIANAGRILYQMGVEDAGDWDSEEDEL